MTSAKDSGNERTERRERQTEPCGDTAAAIDQCCDGQSPPAAPVHEMTAAASPESCAGITAPRRGEHAEELRRRALVDAATAVFAEKGYDAATTREVAERSGSSEGLIHRYFGGKRGLLLAILGLRADGVMEQSAEAMPERATVAEEVEQLLVWPLGLFWEQRDLMRVCVSQSVIDAEVGRIVGERLNGSRVEFIAERLRIHQRAGRVRPDVDIDAVALSMSGLNIALGFFGQVVFEIERGRALEIARQTAGLLARGLGPESTQSGAV